MRFEGYWVSDNEELGGDVSIVRYVANGVLGKGGFGTSSMAMFVMAMIIPSVTPDG